MRALAVVATLATVMAPGTAVAESLPAAVVQPHVVVGAGIPPTSGTPIVAEPGVWQGAPTGYAVTWERCRPGSLVCAGIAGADAWTYTPVGADVGSVLRARVTASGPGGEGSAVTATTDAVVAARPVSSPPAEVPQATVDVAPAADPVDRKQIVGVQAERLRVAFGSVGVLRGRLIGSRGVVGHQGFTVVGASGSAMVAGVTDDAGRFAIAVPATTSGPWTLRGDGWSWPVGVTVVPRITIDRMTTRVLPPHVVRVEGRIRPAVEGKLVQLQYLDPGRGWRLWKQVTTGAGGSFALRRILAANPRAPRFTLRVRVGIPADVGWQYGPVAGAVRTIRVG